MRIKLLVLLVLSSLSLHGFAQESMYCPENEGYIKIGMTKQEIIAACGQPLSKHKSGNIVTQRVPVTQLIYTQVNSGFGWGGTDNLYDQWSLPQGPTGLTLQVDIKNHKVNSIQFNGANSNALSMCSGGSFQVGDDESMVYQACGDPTAINQTYVNQPVPTDSQPEVWIYQNDQYEKPFSLTIINGKLESINQR